MMDAEKYNRSIALHCSTCGGTDFEYDKAEGGPIRCTSCDREFTRGELIRENGATIEAQVDEVKKEIVSDMQKDLHDRLRKSFSGSKYIKFK